MSIVKPSKEALQCNDRVRQISGELFGDTLGNEYRAEFRALGAKGQDGLAVAKTRDLLLDAVMRDPAMATAILGQLAGKSPHGATIYLALELAHLCLVMPSSAEAQDAWVRDMTRLHDKPLALILACLETLERSVNGGKLGGHQKLTHFSE